MSSREPTAATARASTRATARRRPPTAATAAQSPPAPVVLDRYRLQRRLGTGAFGTVWMARDERLERDVAVKILARERIVGGRFEREARAAARLSHPGIVTLFEAAVDDEGAYLVSELVRGSTLDALLADGRLSDRDIVAIAIALCDALAHAHAQGVVHRDVKPSNVLVPDAPASDSQLAKLTDFGVARIVGSDSLTLTGDVIGTLAYMAPEQAEGLEAGPEADLYSLALVVYEALTGVNPVAHRAPQTARRLATHLPPLRRQRRDLPRALGQAVDQALRPRSRERGTVAELRAALALVHGEVGDEPGVVEPPSTPWTTLVGRSDPAEPESAGPLAAGFTAAAPAPEDEPAPGRRRWIGRGLAAVGAAAVVAWVTGVALAPAPIAPAPAALLAAAAVLVVPRLGWIAAIVALCAAGLARGQPGIALVILVALAVPIILLPLRPTLWPLAAAAPALGLVGVAGLAGAWPALAGRARLAWQRGALAAVGWVWLALAAPIAGRGGRVLYLPPPSGGPGRHVWAGSVPGAAHAVLAPLISTGRLAPALVWAAGAAVLPWLIRGRTTVADVTATAVWTALVAAGVPAAIAATSGPGAGSLSAPGAVAGAAAAALVVVVPRAAIRWRMARAG